MNSAEGQYQQIGLKTDEVPKRLDILDVRIPKWNNEDLVSRSCAVCGNAHIEPVYIRPDGLGVRACRNCECFTVSPSPSVDQLNGFYENYHETHFSHESSRIQDIKAELDLERPTQDPRIAWLESHVAMEGAEVLDVGCGKGQFLYQLRRLGANTHGVEFDRSAAETALLLGASTVHVGPIEDMGGSRTFDVIVLNDIIEHPLDPMSLLDHCIERLSPGGIILIWTPNGGGIKTSASPICLRVDLEHMQYLTTGTVTHIANIRNLKVRHLETSGHPSLVTMMMTAAERKKRARIKSLPGVRRLLKMRRSMQSFVHGSDKSGSYHLFACLEK